MSIVIEPPGGVLVTAPDPVTVKRLDAVVRAKASWIVERLKKQADSGAENAPREFVSGETYFYLGRQYRLRVISDETVHPARLGDGYLRVWVPRGLSDDARAHITRVALVNWYKRHARRQLSERIKTWAAKLALDVPEISVTEPRRRWGSASSSGAIRLNWRVIQAPVALVDYVIAHELVHRRHPSHDRAFWAALGRAMPDYEVRKARLRELGRSLVW